MIMHRNRPKARATRVAPRHSERFGAGLLPTSPVYRAPASIEDMLWASQEFTLEPSDWDEDTILDQRAFEAEACDRLSRGYIHGDVAEMIASTRV